MEQQNVAGIQGVLTLEVITIVNVFLDTKVMISPVAKKDACSNGSHNCDSHAYCIGKKNKKGKVSTTCICKEGFDGNGKKCQDIDECAKDKCDSNADCVNTLGSFSYSCECLGRVCLCKWQ